MRLVPHSLRGKALSVAIGSALLANLLCAFLPTWHKGAASRSLPELMELVSLSNLPLGICLIAWAIAINDVEEGCSPTRIQLTTIILFFGTLFPLVTTISTAPLAMTVVRRVLALF